MTIRGDVRMHRRFAPFLSWTLAAPVLFLAFLVVIYLRFGIVTQVTLGIVYLATVPVAAYLKRSSDLVKSSALFVTVLLTYEGLQGVTGALVNTGSVVSLAGVDRWLFGFDLAPAIQSTFASGTLTVASTLLYSLHVFLVVFAILLFLLFDRTVFRSYAYSMTITSYLALVTFIALPSAPPWFTGTAQNLLTSGYTMLPSWMSTFQQLLLSMESDKFAAFPSLHAAYVTLFSYYAIRLNPKYGLLSVPIAAGVYFSILYLGQHYVVDIIGAVAYSAISILLAQKLVPRLRPGSRATVG